MLKSFGLENIFNIYLNKFIQEKKMKSILLFFFCISSSLSFAAATEGKISCWIIGEDGPFQVTISEDGADQKYTVKDVSVNIQTKLPTDKFLQKHFTTVAVEATYYGDDDQTTSFAETGFQFVGYEEENKLVNYGASSKDEGHGVFVKCIRK
jgi:hypothetical protein